MQSRTLTVFIGGGFALLVTAAVISGNQVADAKKGSALRTPCGRADLEAALAADDGDPVSGVNPDLVRREPFVTPPTRRYSYGSNAPQFGDLRLPKGSGPFPVAIVIHGGAWSATASSATSGYRYLSPLAASLACQGIATWNIEYRRVGIGGEWPTLFLDVAQAADYVRVLAKQHPLDLNRVFAVGQSAGGHLALWLALRDKLPPGSVLFSKDPLPILGSISLAGPPDLEHFLTFFPARYGPIFARLFGAEIGSPEYMTRIHQSSPAALLPTRKLQFFIVGNLDPSVPFEVFTAYQALAASKKQSLQLRVVQESGHFDVADPAHPQTANYLREAVAAMLGSRSE